MWKILGELPLARPKKERYRIIIRPMLERCKKVAAVSDFVVQFSVSEVHFTQNHNVMKKRVTQTFKESAGNSARLYGISSKFKFCH
jgi:hypothetical protein